MLEERMPPTQLAWFDTAWLQSEPDAADLNRFVSEMSGILCTRHARSARYACDVAKLLAKAQIASLGPDVDSAAPILRSMLDDSPSVVTAAEQHRLAHSMAMYLHNARVVSMYVYSFALPLLAGIPTELISVSTAPTRLRRVIERFATTVKWHKMGDCYLWGIIQCHIPAWRCASMACGESPWAIFAEAFNDDANQIGRPFISESAAGLLTSMDDSLHTAILIGALALELADKPCSLSINTHVLRTMGSVTPVLCVVRDSPIGSEGVTKTLGYTSGGTFFHHADPYVVISAFFADLARLDPVSAHVHVHGLCGDIALNPDNPLMKYLSE